MLSQGNRLTLRVASLATLLVAGALAPAAAEAATRYAEPAGNGPEPCLEGDPCEIEDAIEGTTGTEVMAGDEIILKPGTYNLGPTVAIFAGVEALNVHGEVGGARPMVNLQNVSPFSMASGTSRLADVQVNNTSGGAVYTNGLIERVIATTTQEITVGACRGEFNAVIRDSVCRGASLSSFGVHSVGAGFTSMSLINVTAVTNGNAAIQVENSGNSGNQEILARNVIANAGGVVDIRAESAQAGSTATVTLSNSNYDTTQPSGLGTSNITTPGTGTNQTAAPTFVNAAGGDFHQAMGSVTINQGAPAAQLGPLDFDREPRIQGGFPDIGADEFPEVAVRYAEPAGDGPHPCEQADPCEIEDAIEGQSSAAEVRDGDEVVLLPGSYSTSQQLIVDDAIDLHGQTGQPRPVIGTSAANGLLIFDSGATVRDLQIDHSGTNAGLQNFGGTAERVIVHATADLLTGACGVFSGGGMDGLVRDSVCWATGGGDAVVMSSVSPGNSQGNLRNVTAVATGLGSHGIRVSAAGSGDLALDARNVIADGLSGVDVATEEVSTGSAAVTLASSNYASEDESAGGTVTNPGSGDNQTATPLFVDAGAGDFHQAAGSPTINAGADHPLIGAFDFDLQARIQAGLPDIGADEFTEAAAPPTSPPPGSAPSNAFEFGPVQRNTKKGIAFLTVNVPGPGEISLTGKGVATIAGARSARAVGAAGPVKLKIKSTGRTKRKLEDVDKAKVNVLVTYVPTGGSPNTQSRRVKLLQR